MGKPLSVSWQGEESSFAISSFDRADLYGQRRRVALDTDGQPCSRVRVTEDGLTVLYTGTTGQGYFLPDGVAIKQTDLESYGADGQPLEKKMSSLSNVEQLQGPVSATRLLDTRIAKTYELEPESLGENLREQLQAGSIFELTFCLRDSYTPDRGFLVANKHGFFILSGEPVEIEWARLDQPVTTPPEVASEDDDDLDFEML